MKRLAWQPLAAATLLVLLVIGWRTVAQTPPAQPGSGAVSNPGLAASDGAVVDATRDAEPGAQAPAVVATADIAAPAVAPELGDYQVSVYRDGVALVRRVETIALNVGRNEFALNGVARTVLPGSAHLRPLDDPQRFEVVEQQGTYVRESSHEVLAAAVGMPVKVRIGDQATSGVLLSADAETLVLQDGSDTVVCPRASAIVTMAGKDEAPPRLDWVVQTERAGSSSAETTYLAKGLVWTVDYLVTLNEASQSVDFEGWVTLENQTGLDLDKVGLRLCDRTAVSAAEPSPANAEWRYWALPQPISLAAGASGRFLITRTAGLRGSLSQVVAFGPGQMRLLGHGLVVPEFRAGAGPRLPKGATRVYQRDAQGRSVLLGTLQAAPSGGLLPLDQLITAPTPVHVAERLTSNQGVVRRVITLRNDSAQDASVTVVEQRPGAWQVLAANVPFTTPGNGELGSGRVTVPAQQQTEVRYQLRVAKPSPTASSVQP